MHLPSSSPFSWTDVIDLIDKRPNGILATLDSACKMPKGTLATLSLAPLRLRWQHGSWLHKWSILTLL